MRFSLLAILAVLIAVPSIAQETAKIWESEGQKFKFETLAERKSIVWGFDFLQDGRIIFTERDGNVGIFDPKTKSVTTLSKPPKVWAKGQGGMLDVRVHYKDANKIYLSYSEPADDGATTAVATATLSGSELSDFKKIFTAHEPNDNQIHFGSRIEFDGKGHIFVTIGDRNERHRAQSLQYHTGKIVRLKEDGSVPQDNPFVKTKDAKPEIWSLGHRSPQGLVRHPETGELWEAEMGPRGGDEVNLIKAGANYGWPVVTFGREYWGPRIGEGTSKAGMEDPVAHWVPSISPSGMTIYNGDQFPKWKGNIFLGCLSGTHLRRLVVSGGKVVKQEELLAKLGLRVRNVRPGPDGFLYLSTDDGRIARLSKP
ncbi:MAG TPA: PQQ-dependent sugar dehydrogenase [Bdellovibrionales bacterium]|nr:PQQ-dependent sugar dehydrogenase [Bdellovibrionales bacterium]